MNILKLIAPDRAYHQWASLLSLTGWILFYHGVYQEWQVKDASKASYILHMLRIFCDWMYAFFCTQAQQITEQGLRDEAIKLNNSNPGQ